jgi:hypothetical protein
MPIWHNDDHRHGFSIGNQVVENKIASAYRAPQIVGLLACECVVGWPSLACNPIFSEPGSSDPIITADIHKRASDCANRRGITIPNTEIGFDLVDSTRRSDDIDLTIHDQYSDEGIIEEILLELAVVDEKQ